MSSSTHSAAPTWSKSLTVLKPGGLAISVVGPPDPASPGGRPPNAPARRSWQLLSRKVHGRPTSSVCATRSSSCTPTAHSCTTLAALYDDGTLRPVVDRTFGFDETLDAIAHVEQGKAKGKIVVTLD